LKRSLLVWISDICTVLFGIGQLYAISQQPAGQSVSWYLSFWLFCVVALAISVQEHKLHPSDGARDRRWAYTLWSIVATINLIVSLAAKWFVASPLWKASDTLNSSIYGSTALVVVIVAALLRQPLHNPFVRGWLGFALKDGPQFFLAWLATQHPDVLPALLAIGAGLTTISVRLKMLGNPIHWKEWNPQQKGLAIAEYPNFISWASVGIVWLTYHLRVGF